MRKWSLLIDLPAVTGMCAIRAAELSLLECLVIYDINIGFVGNSHLNTYTKRLEIAAISDVYDGGADNSLAL
jgi:hypothetical protein